MKQNNDLQVPRAVAYQNGADREKPSSEHLPQNLRRINNERVPANDNILITVVRWSGYSPRVRVLCVAGKEAKHHGKAKTVWGWHGAKA